MKLIKNWKKAWKFYSVQAIFAMSALPAVWVMLPHEWKFEPTLPMQITAFVVMGVVGYLSRIIEQNGLSEDVAK